MVKVRKMTPTSNALGNKTLITKVKDSMKRIGEVNDMMAKRETRYLLFVVNIWYTVPDELLFKFFHSYSANIKHKQLILLFILSSLK